MKSFLEWLKRRVEWDDDELSLRGEYWIDDSGDAQFADGDIGDVNHEGVVINTLQSQIAGSDYDDGESVDWDRFKKDFAERVYEERLAAATPDQKQELTVQYEYDPLYFIDDEALAAESIDKEAYQYAEGFGDAREYALEHWKWKRVKGNSVETWTFDEGDRSILARGLGNIVNDDLGDVDESQIDQIEFYVYVMSSKQDFTVTLPQLEGRSPMVQEPEPQQTQQPIPQPVPTPQQPQQRFFNFMQDAAPYQDIEDKSRVRPGQTDIDLQQKASTNYGYDQDRTRMPKFYKGKFGDWYIPI